MSVNGTASPVENQRKSSEFLEHIQLYIKSGQDGMSQGGCPFCHRIFMLLMIKHNVRALTFTATVVDQTHPPKDWKYGLKLPLLVHNDEVLDEVEEMCTYIDKNFPEPPMLPELPAANTACINIFPKFNYYVKSPSTQQKGPGQMVGELRKLNEFLEKSDMKYLCGDELSHLDCIMLPKLQHIRLVAKAFKDFDMPSDLKDLWRYLGNAYKEPVFTECCPSDQEIVQHWVGRPGLPTLSKEATSHYRTTTAPRYSFDIPEELRAPPAASEEKPLAQNDVFEPETPTSPESPMTPMTPTSAEPKYDPPVYSKVELPGEQNAAVDHVTVATSKPEVTSETVAVAHSAPAPPEGEAIYTDVAAKPEVTSETVVVAHSAPAPPEGEAIYSTIDDDYKASKATAAAADEVVTRESSTGSARPESGVSDVSEKSEGQKSEKSDGGTSDKSESKKSDSASSPKSERKRTDSGSSVKSNKSDIVAASETVAVEAAATEKSKRESGTSDDVPNQPDVTSETVVKEQDGDLPPPYNDRAQTPPGEKHTSDTETPSGGKDDKIDSGRESPKYAEEPSPFENY